VVTIYVHKLLPTAVMKTMLKGPFSNYMKVCLQYICNFGLTVMTHPWVFCVILISKHFDSWYGMMAEVFRCSVLIIKQGISRIYLPFYGLVMPCENVFLKSKHSAMDNFNCVVVVLLITSSSKENSMATFIMHTFLVLLLYFFDELITKVNIL
jgi:hypothetical protein